MKNDRRRPSRRNPLAAQLSHGAYRPKKVPGAKAKADARSARPKHPGASDPGDE